MGIDYTITPVPNPTNQNALQSTEQICKNCSVNLLEQAHLRGCPSFLFAGIKEEKPSLTASHLLNKRLDLIKQGKYAEISFSFKALTKITKALYPGTVTLFCGAPGSCKSLFLLQQLNHWHDIAVPACILAIEGDMEHHMMRALAQRTLTTGLTEIEWIDANYEEAAKILEDCEIFTDEFAQTIHLPDKKLFNLDTTVAWVIEMAQDGKRIIVIDPVTKIPNGAAQGWTAEANFINQMEEVATKYGISIILVTHPKNGLALKPSMESLAGSAAYSRFSHTILWLEAHDEITGNVQLATGPDRVTYNRTLHTLKARNGNGQGVADAFNFSIEGLLMTECGPITKK